MRCFGKHFVSGVQMVVLLMGTMALGQAFGEEPKPFMMTGADVYWERALAEIKKQKPEMDTTKLRHESVMYSYDPPQQTPWWSESVRVVFGNPSTDKAATLGGYQAVSSTHVVVQFLRNPKHEHEPEVQVQLAPYTKLIPGSNGPLSDDTKVSPAPTPLPKPTTVR